MPIDMFPQTSDIWLKIHRYVPILRHQSGRIEPCGDGSIDVKGTEVNSVNSLKIKHLRAFGQPSEGCLDTRIFAFGEQINRRNQRAS